MDSCTISNTLATVRSFQNWSRSPTMSCSSRTSNRCVKEKPTYCGPAKLNGLRKVQEPLPVYQSTYPSRKKVLRNATFRVADSNSPSIVMPYQKRKFSKAWVCAWVVPHKFNKRATDK